MRHLLILFSFAVLVLSQLDAIPPCAQSCFSTALDVAGCVIDGLMDPTCACTSYLFTNSLGGHDTGIDYARYLCIDLKPASGCNEHDLGLFDDSLNDICYNKDNSPKWNCGVIPGDPVPPQIPKTATGEFTMTLSAASGVATATFPVYPTYTYTMGTSIVYTTKVVTVTLSETTTTYTTRSSLYEAVCPTTFMYTGSMPKQTYVYPYWGDDSEPTTTIENLYSELTAAAASASVASVAAAKESTSERESRIGVVTSSKTASLSSTGSHSGTSTGTTAPSLASKSGGSKVKARNVKAVLAVVFISSVLVAAA